MPLRALISSILISLTPSSTLLAVATTPAVSVASSYSLTTSTVFAFPTTTLDIPNSDGYVIAAWGTDKKQIENGQSTLQFVDDPFPNNPVPVNPSPQDASSPVLQITYPAGSVNNATGGGQFISTWNTSHGAPFETMLLTYELAFDTNFQWVKGGKLPGIRGGPSIAGCSGGKESTGTDCFSARVMWRTDGEGESTC